MKNAKIILQNRNIRGKFHESLKDYQEEIETVKQRVNCVVTEPSAKQRKTPNKKKIIVCRRAVHICMSDDLTMDRSKQTPNHRVHCQNFNKPENGIFSTFDFSSRSFTPSSRHARFSRLYSSCNMN